MRNAFLILIVVATAACTGNMGGSGGSGGSGGTGGLGGTGGSGGGGGGGGVDPNGTPAFEITSSDIMVMPGTEPTYCYYFHTPNTETIAVNKWVSTLARGSHHMIMYLNPGGSQPADGTIDQSCAGGGIGLGNLPVWTYATQMEFQEVDLPGDDGSGKPLAQNIAPHSAGYFQMHYLNATPNTVTAHVDLKAYALPAGTSYTETEAYVTYNDDISIGPGATNVAVTASCPVPAATKFWSMSTHSHKQSIATQVLDGSSMIFSSTDWEHPGSRDWNAPSFYAFTASKLTWTCTYDNIGANAGSTVVAGPSAQTNEMCMATGYYFPATAPKFGFFKGGKCYVQ
jgi:hypothetical protein